MNAIFEKVTKSAEGIQLAKSIESCLLKGFKRSFKILATIL